MKALQSQTERPGKSQSFFRGSSFLRLNHYIKSFFHYLSVSIFIFLGFQVQTAAALLLDYDFSEGTGNTLYDQSGYGNNGTIYGAQWTSEGAGGYSLCFDGNDDYVLIPDDSSLRLGDEFTIEVTVKPGENPIKSGFGDYRLIIGKAGEFWDTNNAYSLYVVRQCLAYLGTVRNDSDLYQVKSDTAVRDTWHTVSLVKKDDKLKIFWNGIYVSSMDCSQTINTSNQSLRIGGISGRYFEGYISHVSIYDSAVLQETETEKGYVLNCDFTEDTENTLYDQSGYGNNGTIYGAQWTSEGAGGYSLCFDGNDDYVLIPDDSSLRLGDEFTIEVTVKPGENPIKSGFGDYRLIIGKAGEYWDTNNAYSLYVTRECGDYIGCLRNNSDLYKVLSDNVTQDIWQKLLLTRTKDSLSLYVDSILEDVKSDPSLMTSSQPLKIGGVSGRYFEGYIKQLAIYNYVKPYLLMVTSTDQDISSTPLLDVSDNVINAMNDSPFDGICFSLLDAYSGQPLPDSSTMISKANHFKTLSGRKDIWVRVNLNRIYKRAPESYYFESGHTMEEVNALDTSGETVAAVRKVSTPYFADISVADIFDTQGKLTDFKTLWSNALVFCNEMQTGGIVLDCEDYHNNTADKYCVTAIAEAQSRTEAEVINQLQQIGRDMADEAKDKCPSGVRIMSLFTMLSSGTDAGGNFPTIYYISKGFLDRAKEIKQTYGIPLILIEGGETEINYVNRTLTGLQQKIFDRWAHYYALENDYYSDCQLRLGGTVTVWRDSTQNYGWVADDAGTPAQPCSLDYTFADPDPQHHPNFREVFKKLFDYDYIFFYVPSCTEYKPYDLNYSGRTDFHNILKEAINESLEEMKKR
ncbi:MAG: LamG domain-containing protein [Victivallaceae bacterium]|nr:LamG domain-containing protein [Victivallaceae bacterium]